MSERLTFRAPTSFTFGEDKKGWNLVTVDGKRKLVCFDEALIKAFEAANLAGVEHDYEVTQPKDAKKDPILAAIPGVYTKPKGAGRAATGPMFTDRQVALIASVASGATDVLVTADRFVAWLASSKTSSTAGGAAPSRAAGTSAVTGGPSSAADVPPPQPAQAPTLDEIRQLAKKAGVEVDTICAQRQVGSLAQLSEPVAQEVLANLRRYLEQQQAS